jgi:hypothetical protein
MAALGILSFFQITLLPGLIILSASRYPGSLLSRMFLAFSLSLTANYVAVLVLAAAGLYVRPVVFAIFAAELVVIAWLRGAAIRRWFLSPLLRPIIEPAAAEIRRLRELSGPGIAGLVRTIAATAALLLGLFEIGQTLVIFVANWGTIFKFEDAVLSWNRWALDWFHNRLPTGSYHYPQLLPTNWSIGYVFMNMPLQYIARGMMPLFMLALLIAMLDMGWTRKTAGPYLATLVAAYMYPRLQIDLTEGMADLPVSCMVFLAFCCVVAAQRESAARWRTWYLVIGAVLAAGAAVTKQPGVFFLPIYPVLAYVFVLREQSGEGRARVLRLAAVYITIVLVIVFPFYVYAQMQINAGLASSEISYVTNGIFAGRAVPERIVNAARMFLDHIGPVPTFLMVLLGLIALGDKVSRWVIALIVVPWVLLWAALASYDLRNLALAVPFIAASVGTGAAAVGRGVIVSPVQGIKTAYRRLVAVRAWTVVTPAAALIAVSVGLALLPTRERLIAHHRRMERELGNAALNAQLYAQYDRQPFSRLILTNYGFLFHLPDLADLGVFENFFRTSTPESAEFAEYRKHLEDPRIGYILLSIDAYPSIMRDVEERLEHGDFKLLFRAEGYLFVEIIRR